MPGHGEERVFSAPMPAELGYLETSLTELAVRERPIGQGDQFLANVFVFPFERPTEEDC